MPRDPEIRRPFYTAITLFGFALAASAQALGAGFSPEDAWALLHSAGGRFVLAELGLTAEAVDAASLGTDAAASEKLRQLTQGLDEIRGRWTGEHPENRPLFEGSSEPLTETERESLRGLLRRESGDFANAVQEIRGYGSARAEFLAARPDGAGPLHMTPVTDQGDTLQCWAVTATARMDVDASARAGRLLKLSPRFTVYAKTRAEVIDLILGAKFKTYRGQLSEGGPFENIYYEQGGVFADAVEAVKLYGAVPEEAYPGFPKKDEGLFRDLNDVIRDYARKAKAGQVDFADPAVREEVEREVTAVMNRRWGKPPASFEYQGRTFDPKSFLAEYLPDWQNPDAIELNYAPGNHDLKGTTKAFDGAAYRSYKTANHGKLMRVLEESLRAGLKPILQYKVVDEEHTQHNAEIGFEVHGLEKPAHLKWNDKNILDHYVLAAEPEWDAQGHLRRLLVKNTWDTSQRANFGFHWIEADYFSLFEAVEIHPSLEARFRQEGLLQ